MYRSDNLVELAYECYYEQSFANTSYVLGFDYSSTPAYEAFSDKVRSLKDKLLEVMERVIDFIKKLLGIDTKLNEVTVSEPEQIKHMMQFINHYQELYKYGQKLFELGKVCISLYRSNGEKGSDDKVVELSHELDEYRRIIDDVSDNIPATFVFKYPEVKSRLNKLNAMHERIKSTLKGLPESSRSQAAYNGAYNIFREKTTYFNLILSNIAHTVKVSVYSKGERQMLNFQKLFTDKGTNVIAGKVAGKPAFTYVASDDTVIQKWGSIFVVVDPELYNKLSKNAKNMLIQHEMAHVELFKMNEDESFTGAEKEYHCDEVAYQNLNLTIDQAVDAIKEITNAYIKMDPVRGAKYKAIGGARMKHLLESKKQKEDVESSINDDDDTNLDLDSTEDKDTSSSLDDALNDLNDIDKEDKSNKDSKDEKVDDNPDLDEAIKDIDNIGKEDEEDDSSTSDDFDDLDDLKDISKFDKEEKESSKKKSKKKMDELDDLDLDEDLGESSSKKESKEKDSKSSKGHRKVINEIDKVLNKLK